MTLYESGIAIGLGSMTVIASALALILARNPRPGPGEGASTYRYHASFRWLTGGLAASIPGCITVMLFFLPPKNDGDLYAIFFIYTLFAALTLPLAWEVCLFAAILTDKGIDGRSPWRGRRFLPYAKLTRVTFSEQAQVFVIRGEGRWFCVPFWTARIGELLDRLERECPDLDTSGADVGYHRLGRTRPGADAVPTGPLTATRRYPKGVDLSKWSEKAARPRPEPPAMPEERRESGEGEGRVRPEG